jgi:hypothetical protein
VPRRAGPRWRPQPPAQPRRPASPPAPSRWEHRRQPWFWLLLALKRRGDTTVGRATIAGGWTRVKSVLKSVLLGSLGSTAWRRWFWRTQTQLHAGAYWGQPACKPIHIFLCALKIVSCTPNSTPLPYNGDIQTPGPRRHIDQGRSLPLPPPLFTPAASRAGGHKPCPGNGTIRGPVREPGTRGEARRRQRRLVRGVPR